MGRLTEKLISLTVIAGLAIMVAASGCGDESQTSSIETVSTAKTGTSTTATTVKAATTPADTPTTPAPAPEPAPAPSPVPVTLEIIARAASPEVVAPGAPITFTASIRGTAASATISVFNRTSGALVLTSSLSAGATSGDITAWSGNATAPAVPGEYRYYASATGAGGTVEMPGVSGWTFCVGDPEVDCT